MREVDISIVVRYVDISTVAKQNNSLGQVVIQSKKKSVQTPSPTSLGVRAFQSCQGLWHYSWVFRVHR